MKEVYRNIDMVTSINKSSTDKYIFIIIVNMYFMKQRQNHHLPPSLPLIPLSLLARGKLFTSELLQ